MPGQPKGQSILIADDEPEVVDLVRMILEWEGYQVITATDGQEALTRVQESSPDLILLDVRMPKLSGLGVLDQLGRQADAPIPVIMLSVVTTYPEVRTALQRGAVAYLSKPFELKEMTRLVSQILEMDLAKREAFRLQALESLERGW